MAVPKRRKSKSKSRKNRTHYNLKKPGLSQTGDEFHLPHHISDDGFYNGQYFSKFDKTAE